MPRIYLNKLELGLLLVTCKENIRAFGKSKLKKDVLLKEIWLTLLRKLDLAKWNSDSEQKKLDEL